MTKVSDQTKAAILGGLEYVYLLQFFKQDASTPNRRLLNQVITLNLADAMKVIYEGMTDDEKGLCATAGVRDAILKRLGDIVLNNSERPVKLFGLEIYRIWVFHK